MNKQFTFNIQIAGGLVQNQNAWIGQHRARDGKSLALAARKPHATLANAREILLGHFADESVTARQHGGLLDFVLGGVLASVRNIVGDGAIEKKNILLNNAKQATPIMQAVIAQVRAVDQDAPRGWIKEARDEIAQRGLARAACANKRHSFAGQNIKGDAVDHRSL